RAIPALVRRIADRGQHGRADHPVTTALDHLRYDLVGLLGQLHAGLPDAAIVDRVWVQRLYLGQDRAIVGRLRVKPVAAHDGDALGLGLLLERIGHTHTVGAAVIQDIDRLHLQDFGIEVRHVWALEGIRRNGTEIDWLAGRAELV